VARSSGISAGALSISLPKLTTAERRSRLRVSERLLVLIKRSMTSCSVAGTAVVLGLRSSFMVVGSSMDC
jgi:hypothetical protein